MTNPILMAKRRSSSKESDNVEPDTSQFMVKDYKRSEEKDTRKGMKTSDEIKVFDVGDAPVMDYIKEEKQDIIEYDESADVIELKSDSMEHLDVSKAKTVKINGKSTREDLGKQLKADFSALKEARFDSRKSFLDIKRNIDEYRPLCDSCRNSLKCSKCEGNGKIMLMRKCPECGGSGMCDRCSSRQSVKCPNCLKKLSLYATHCTDCGTAFTCPSCYSPIPSTATRCLKCRTEFSCKNCRGVIAPAMDDKCPKCGAEKWFAKPKRELPIRKLEKEKK
ncbi:MAG: hypothetical protein JSV49_01615 [Thermoplasmata archaeon]|nr:MAG: hypothetical protein JSV49_01615 [Thermoplasmata archaeon]